jgi:hypothetical protein
MSVVKLYDEVILMSELKDETILLIHATDMVTCIKKLIEAHDILNLNLEITKYYKDFSVDPVIDKCAFIDLNRIRTHLIVFHLGDFRPPSIVHRYSQKIIRLFNILDLNIAA